MILIYCIGLYSFMLHEVGLLLLSQEGSCATPFTLLHIFTLDTVSLEVLPSLQSASPPKRSLWPSCVARLISLL